MKLCHLGLQCSHKSHRLQEKKNTKPEKNAFKGLIKVVQLTPKITQTTAVVLGFLSEV